MELLAVFGLLALALRASVFSGWRSIQEQVRQTEFSPTRDSAIELH